MTISYHESYNDDNRRNNDDGYEGIRSPVVKSQGCWFGLFKSKSNLFCEVNTSGQKPNLSDLASQKQSAGIWIGTFIHKKSNVDDDGDVNDNLGSGNGKKTKKKKSNMICDGGGWFRSEKQRTSFLLVVQDEVIKPDKKKSNVKLIENGGISISSKDDDINVATPRQQQQSSPTIITTSSKKNTVSINIFSTKKVRAKISNESIHNGRKVLKAIEKSNEKLDSSGSILSSLTTSNDDFTRKKTTTDVGSSSINNRSRVIVKTMSKSNIRKPTLSSKTLSPKIVITKQSSITATKQRKRKDEIRKIVKAASEKNINNAGETNVMFVC